jgi:hypothetical protein
MEESPASAIAGQSDARGPRAQARDRIVLGAGDDEHCAVVLSRECLDECPEADRESEGLVRPVASEGDQFLLGGRARDHVSVGDPTHGDVRDERTSVRARHRDRERIRPGERRSAVGVREAGRRRGRQGRDEPTVGEPPHPVTEEPCREAAGGDDHPRTVRRFAELRLDDSRKREVADGAVSVPVLVPELGEDAKRLRVRVQILQGAEPGDAGDAVARPAAAVGVLEVVGEETGVFVGEAERDEIVERAQAETSGRGLTIPTPCSRFVAAIASARARIARDTSASGSASTIGSPSSA